MVTVQPQSHIVTLSRIPLNDHGQEITCTGYNTLTAANMLWIPEILPTVNACINQEYLSY